MAKIKPIEIAFVGLKPGLHEFTYDIKDSFFDVEIPRDFANCSANVKLLLDKKTNFFLLKFEIWGKADVSCDRCNNILTKDLWDEFNMVMKMVDNPVEMNEQEEDPDIHYISKTDTHLHLNDWIYEFVTLSVPFQKMCTDEEFWGPKCNKEVLEKLKALEVKEVDHNATTIWKGLDQFKSENN